MWEGVDNYYIKTLTNRYRVDTCKPIDETGKFMGGGDAYMYLDLRMNTVMLFPVLGCDDQITYPYCLTYYE
jgi:hypothetical protein